jgi:type II secretory pathway pseudopilin PulG
MSQRPIRIQSPARRAQLGFTMVEMMLVFVLIGIMVGMMVPKIGRALQANEVNRAAAIVAGDMESAFARAARQRKPVRLDCTCGTAIYTVADRAGTVLLTRNLRAETEIRLLAMTFTPGPPTNALPIEIFPPGIADKTLTIRITSGASTRAVTVSTVGQVRIIP